MDTATVGTEARSDNDNRDCTDSIGSGQGTAML